MAGTYMDVETLRCLHDDDNEKIQTRMIVDVAKHDFLHRCKIATTKKSAWKLIFNLTSPDESGKVVE